MIGSPSCFLTINVSVLRLWGLLDHWITAVTHWFC